PGAGEATPRRVPSLAPRCRPTTSGSRGTAPVRGGAAGGGAAGGAIGGGAAGGGTDAFTDGGGSGGALPEGGTYGAPGSSSGSPCRPLLRGGSIGPAGGLTGPCAVGPVGPSGGGPAWRAGAP